MYPAYTHPKMVTPASASGTDQVFVNNVTDGSGGAAGVKGDGVDTGRVSAGSGSGGGGDAVEVGSQAGSLQGSRKSSVSGSTKQYLADLQAQCSVL